MRFADRGGSVNPTSEQQVEIYHGLNITQVALQISDMVAKYAIRIVSMVGSPDFSGDMVTGYTAIVVFEEEPLRDEIRRF